MGRLVSVVFACLYQCSWLSGKIRLWNDLLPVEWTLNPTHSPAPSASPGEIVLKSSVCGQSKMLAMCHYWICFIGYVVVG